MPKTPDRDLLAIQYLDRTYRMAGFLSRARPHLRDEAKSEAIVQLVAASRAWGQQGNFHGFLYTYIQTAFRKLCRAMPACESEADHVSLDRMSAVPLCTRDPWSDRDRLMDAMRTLPAAHAEVVRHRYGLGGREPRRPGWVAKKMGRSREWVVRAEGEALGWLRSRIEQMREHTED